MDTSQSIESILKTKKMSNFFQTFGLGQQGCVYILVVRVQHLPKQPSPDHLRQNTDQQCDQNHLCSCMSLSKWIHW